MESALKERLRKGSLYSNMHRIKCIKITGLIDYFPAVIIMNSCVNLCLIK